MDRFQSPCDSCPTNVKVVCNCSLIRCKETDCAAYIAWRNGEPNDNLPRIYSTTKQPAGATVRIPVVGA
jgi:hypothetical protein